MTRLRVTVLAGGWSSEREVSLVSGQAVADALKRQHQDVVIVDPVNDLVRFAAQLAAAKPDVIFNALHGTGGEDGVIQGALEMFGKPYTHSGLAACAMAMDKTITKNIARQNDILLADGRLACGAHIKSGSAMAMPFVVKPNADGSSVGVHIVENDADMQTLQKELQDDKIYMIEKFVAGRDLVVAVLDDGQGAKALGITELVSTRRFYDYTAKYTDGVTTHVVDPELPVEVKTQMKTAAEKIHTALGCRDVSRSDFRYNPADGAVFLEINTHPGFTPLSTTPEQAAAKGIAFDRLVVTLLNQALCRAGIPLLSEAST